MILLDKRAGSKDLEQLLIDRGLAVDMVMMEFGDLAWTTTTTDGKSLQVGIEFKTVQDAVSSLRTGRLSGHQAVGMSDAYDINILIIEGETGTNSSGLLTTPHFQGRKKVWTPVYGKMTSAEFHKRLFTLQFTGGFHILFTNSRDSSISLIHWLYSWFTDKPMDAHLSHLQEHDDSGWLPISDFRAVLKRFPGIGYKMSGVAESHFGNLRRAANAPSDEWAKLATVDSRGQTKRLGLKVASRIVEWLRGE